MGFNDLRPSKGSTLIVLDSRGVGERELGVFGTMEAGGDATGSIVHVAHCCGVYPTKGGAHGGGYA
jgi:hypothetical protein